MPRIIFLDPDGTRHEVDGEVGLSVMEVAKRHGIAGIEADCGGACACATCHVHVDPEWAGRLPPASAEEIDMLDGAFDVREGSRLSCQILVTPELNGLRLKLAPGTER